MRCEPLRSVSAEAGVEVLQEALDSALWLGDRDLAAAALPGLRLERAQGIFDRLRAVKDEDEIANLRRAAHAHDAGYRAAHEILRPGLTVAEAG